MSNATNEIIVNITWLKYIHCRAKVFRHSAFDILLSIVKKSREIDDTLYFVKLFIKFLVKFKLK